MKQLVQILLWGLLFSGALGAATIPVLLNSPAPAVERLAAADLSQMLGRIYPNNEFPLITAAPASEACIVIGDASDPALKNVAGDALRGPESFAVLHLGNRGLIIGADPRGASYGVYRLLEKLGCGFYESFDVVPPPSAESFSFAQWNFADAPTVSRRFVFEWHNFLSGCSSWDLGDWKQWILQSHKMGFNGIMVHAYGDNPMVCFSCNGQTKPVGWLSSTINGRDWGTEHVEDVRRIIGGDIFPGPVFGSAAALVDDDHRVGAAKNLMRQVFAYAKELDMEVLFAVDVDTEAANPQNILNTLPASARYGIAIGSVKNPETFQLANPDTPEGLAYFRALFGTLLSDYPQIDQLILWVRQSGTPGMEVTSQNMPQSWLSDYRHALHSGSRLRDDGKSASLFALSRIVQASRTVLDQQGHGAVKLGIGSWRFGYLDAADRFMPPQVSFFSLDSEEQFADPKFVETNKPIFGRRSVFPIFWIQDDDRAYLGVPFAPVANLTSVLHGGGASGFGIVQWMTHPFDLYFRNMADQAWQQTSDQNLKATLDRFGEILIGGGQGAAFSDYLNAWWTDGPRFGRETSDRMIDQPLDATAEAAKAQPRLAILNQISELGLSPLAKAQLDYYKSFEAFTSRFFQSQDALDKSTTLLKQGDLGGAREALKGADPEAVIELYRQSLHGLGMTKGELGLLISLNLRWLPEFIYQRQALGLEPIRVAFAPTQHDELAQGQGKNTFRFDDHKNLWVVLGSDETKAVAYVLPPETAVHSGKDTSADSQELCRAGVRFSRGYTYTSTHLPAGHYRVRLIAMDPDSTTVGERVFKVTISGASPPFSPLDIFSETGVAATVIENDFDVMLSKPASIKISLNPEKGDAILSGLIIEPTG
jgi:hypothetical protein